MAIRSQKKRRYPFKQKLSRKFRRIVFMIIAAALASGINYYNNHKTASNVTISHIDSNQFTAVQQKQAISKIREAQNNTNAQFWVGFNGKIVQKLNDDNKGSRHQKFLVSPESGITILVAHNIDLAPRVPIDKGDTISLYGRFEWNHKGGVMHWTHHDPKGKIKGGWINTKGKIYQ